jgi:hypothetical protein
VIYRRRFARRMATRSTRSRCRYSRLPRSPRIRTSPRRAQCASVVLGTPAAIASRQLSHVARGPGSRGPGHRCDTCASKSLGVVTVSHVGHATPGSRCRSIATACFSATDIRWYGFEAIERDHANRPGVALATGSRPAGDRLVRCSCRPATMGCAPQAARVSGGAPDRRLQAAARRARRPSVGWLVDAVDRVDRIRWSRVGVSRVHLTGTGGGGRWPRYFRTGAPPHGVCKAPRCPRQWFSILRLTVAARRGAS